VNEIKGVHESHSKRNSNNDFCDSIYALQSEFRCEMPGERSIPTNPVITAQLRSRSSTMSGCFNSLRMAVSRRINSAKSAKNRSEVE
jgi:hypothetical protein